MAYELVNISPERKHFLYEEEMFWKYRPKITFEFMVNEFNKVNKNQEKYKILKKFADEFHQLELLANLTPIVRLVKSLVNSLDKKIKKSVLHENSIQNFVNEYLPSL